MSEVLLGVSGGIASYKSATLLRLFTEAGHSVRVIPTASSLNFVGAATWEALSGKPVQIDVFENVDSVAHVRIGQSADLVVVAPATANLLAKAAHGLADDLLTNTLLTVRCPIVFAPAMHTEMWENAATRANVATLRTRGHTVIEPAVGRLTGKDSGKGRLPEPEAIYSLALQLLDGQAHGADLAGRHVAISAGGTREYLDPVRFLGNRSSGKQGFALVEAAVARGAKVTVVAANVALPTPAGADVIPVSTTEELREQMMALSGSVDAIIMAAAPADFRPATRATSKIKKSPTSPPSDIALIENPDILAELVRSRDGLRPLIVGFAAETGDDAGTVLEHGRAKLQRKGCEFLVVNEVGSGRGFEQDENEAVILGADGTDFTVPMGPKIALAHAILDHVVQQLDKS